MTSSGLFFCRSSDITHMMDSTPHDSVGVFEMIAADFCQLDCQGERYGTWRQDKKRHHF